MPLSFVKKNLAQNGAASEESKTTGTTGASQQQSPSTTAKKTYAGPSFLKTGQGAKDALVAEETKAALAKEDRDRLWRFWLKPDEERQITFLDGEIDADGMLTCPMAHEHQMKINGETQTFMCTAEAEGYCPICAAGESGNYLIGVATILDHSPYTIKSGTNAGKIIQHSRKLLVAKKTTIRLLSKIASKRGGLTGATFDVSRGDDKTASVGSQFDFVEKQSLADVAKKYNLKLEDVAPANYEWELAYKTSDELLSLGIGKPQSGPGYSNKSSGGSKNLSDEL